MRLIDADAITNATIDDIQLCFFDCTPYVKVEDLLNYIDKLPTKYDIDKVVEELEFLQDNCFQNGIYEAYENAIKIVKKGENNETNNS